MLTLWQPTMRSISVPAAAVSVFTAVPALSSSDRTPEFQTPQAPSSFVVFESLHCVSQGWTKLEKLDPSTRLRFRIALEMPEHALTFEQTLYDISTHGHESYSQHLNHEVVKAFVNPRDEWTMLFSHGWNSPECQILMSRMIATGSTLMLHWPRRSK